jgi:membrane-bound lytic murein transglycosylase A
MQKVDLGRFHPRWEGQTLIYRLEEGEVVPYYERSQIDGKEVLEGKNLEIAWAKDPVDVFFLQIQGSGRLVLPNGERRHIVYAGKNGRQYVSLGRVLVERGLLSAEEVSMQSIRDCLSRHPYLMQELLFTNPSYVFFRLAPDGPYGAMGKTLTPKFSLATDPELLPLGSALVYNVALPSKDSENGLPLTALGSAQDVGGAIKNHHLDIFFGCGQRASFLAGHMQEKGRVFLLLLREGSKQTTFKEH